MRTKFRKTLTREQRFARVLAKVPGEDPVFPVFMHGIERYLLGEMELSEMDKRVRHLVAASPLLSKTRLQEWVQCWHALPVSVKAQFVPPELKDLDPSRKLDMPSYKSVLTRLSPHLPTPRLDHRVPKSLADTFEPARKNAVTITAITPTEPDGTPFVYFGQAFAVRGTGFEPDPQQDTIVIYGEQRSAPMEVSLCPTAATKGTLQATAPLAMELAPGTHKVGVFVRGKGLSNLMDVTFAEAPGAAGVIASVTPAAQFPGKKVLINGSGFRQNPRVFWRATDPALEPGVCYGTEVEYLSDTQLSMTVPDRMVYFPGAYLIAAAGENQGVSNWVPLAVRPFKYRVRFGQITCIDESDPEWWGDDEIVARWAIACDGQTWAKQSSEYTGFSDGTTKSMSDEDKKVFLPGDGPGEVKQGLTIGTLLFEWDAGDAQAWTKVLDEVAGFCKDGWLAWVGYALKFASKLIALCGGDPDALGQNILIWTAADLRDRTNNSQLQFSDTISFLNGDDTGSYQLNYAVTRVED
jgi:hypothetical protein